MGWREMLRKEIVVPLPGLPEGWMPRVPRPRVVAWYGQQHEHDQRAVLTQLAAIVSTNASLPHGLRACAEDAPNRRVARVLQRLAAHLETGRSLGEAMMTCRGFFEPHWVGLVIASEKTGALARSLRSILDALNADIETGHIARNRVAYFLFLLIAQLLIMSFIVWRIVPVFVEVLAEFSEIQPIPVRILQTVSTFAASNTIPLLIVAALVAIAVAFGRGIFRLSRMVQSAVTPLALALPVCGGYFRAHILESIASMLQVLCRGGMPLPEALRTAAAGGLPRPYERALMRVAAAVEQGESLSTALARHRRLFSERFEEFVRFGEGREDLAGAFAQARDLYRRRVVRRRRALTDALVPAGVAVCGAVVLLASLSLFTLLTTIADSITHDIF